MFWKKKLKYDFYLAGGMRGYKDLNKPMFALVAKLLREKGFTVWSPSEHKSYLKLSFGQVMTIDLNKVINECRKIALLPGWRESLGANGESFAAFCCGKEAVEVELNDGKTEIDLIPLDLNNYNLPYQTGGTRRFNPHQCPLDSFEQSDVIDDIIEEPDRLRGDDYPE